MEAKKGQVSVTTENIFPIIRQWLYQDKDIFLRELVSNAADALAKFSRLTLMGQAEGDDKPLQIDITYDGKAGTLQIADNGIGMSFAEIEKYINQIAYSGMVDFAERFKGEGSAGGAFIGHFGLGFYSSFMVADTVRIDSKSYGEEAAAFWQSEDGIDYEMGPGERASRGTTITLYLNEEAKKEFDAHFLEDVLTKYCGFMAWPIYFHDANAEPKDDAEHVVTPLNDPEPLWKKNPQDISDDEYKAFYKKVFADHRDPLFWIHLNMDYPFRLQGILYFPKADRSYETLDGRIKIYYNQVFVADNIKEIIPDFLFLLRGTLDAPDLPLNVSRSFLQNDQYVRKLSGHIIRKVADKLVALAKDDFDTYTTFWNDIDLFVKYGMMKEDRFYDRAKEALLFEKIDGTFVKYSEVGEGKLLYTPGKDQLAAYVAMATEAGTPVYLFDHEIDNQFLSFLEYKSEGKLSFERVDASIGAEATDQVEKRDLLESHIRTVVHDDKLTVRLASLGESGLLAMFEESEQARRLQELKEQFEQFALAGDDGADLFARTRALVINVDSPLLDAVVNEAVKGEPDPASNPMTQYVYDVARLSQHDLHGDDLVRFLKLANTLLAKQNEV